MPQQQNKINYQKELEKVLDKEKERVPTLLLHSCCAPCSSYVLEYLAQYFSITVFYYNPNIYSEAEYEKRVEEQQRLIREMNAKNQLALCTDDRQEKKASGQNRGRDKGCGRQESVCADPPGQGTAYKT